MLPKQHSFKLRQQRGFFYKAERYFSHYFTLFYVPAEALKTVVVIPKKVVRLATGRNKLRREIESYLLETIPEVKNTSASFFVCLVAKSAAVSADKTELLTELKKAYTSLKKT